MPVPDIIFKKKNLFRRISVKMPCVRATLAMVFWARRHHSSLLFLFLFAQLKVKEEERRKRRGGETQAGRMKLHNGT